MEIDVDKAKNILFRTAIVITAAAMVWFSRGIWLSWFQKGEPASDAPWAAVETAAEDLATEFYTVDYRDQLDWQLRLEPTCSEMGWALMERFLPQIWQMIAGGRVISTVTSVDAGEPVTAGQTPIQGIPYVVVPVTVETDITWPGGENPIIFYAVMELVENTEENGVVWKFQSFMSADAVAEAQAAAAAATAQPIPTTEEAQP